MAPRLIIAIPSYNRPDALKTLLAQLDAQTDAPTFDVYVLNDGNHPESARLLETFSPRRYRLKARATDAPSGLPRARNRMLDWVAEDWNREPLLVCFLDDDCEVNTFFVQEVMRAARRFGAFTFRIETIGQSGIVNTRGNRILSWLLRPFRGRVLLPLGIIRGGYYEWTPRPVRVDHLPGGCLIYRFDRYPRLRFDEALNDGNAILEDTDFSCALRTEGARLRYIGSFGIVHRPGSAGGVRVRVPREKYYYYWKHKWILVGKWAGRWAYPFAFCVGVGECVLLSLLSRQSLVGVFLRSWRRVIPASDTGRLRICAPQSGINPDSTLGGEVYDASVLKEIAKHADVEVIIPRNRPFSDGGARWHVMIMPAIKSAIGYYLNIYRALGRSYRAHPFSVVRVHSPYITAIPILLFAYTRKTVKTFASYLHIEEDFLSRMITRVAVKRWDAIGVISNATKNELVSSYGVDPSKIVVTYPGVDDSYFAPLSHERLQDFKAAHDLTNRFVILHLGSLIARKNVSFLIEVIATLPARALLVVAGIGSQKSQLEQMALKSGCSDRVRFAGKVSEEDKIMWMHAADVFALASHKEGFGMGVAQAGACGTPGIVSDAYSLPEVVADGSTGAVRPLEVDAWRATLQMWMDDPDLVRHLGEQARVHAHESFSWEKAAVAQVEHIRAMMNNIRK